MERPHPPQKENKLFLLYAFEQVGAMTQQQINRLVIENELMEYLDLQLSLAELIDAELLQTLSVDDVRYLSLTSRAQETLRFFKAQVPHSRLVAVDEIAQEWRRRFAKERQMTAHYTRTKHGDYEVRLTAREGGLSLVRISLSVSDRKQAAKLCANWEQKAGEAYRVLMEALLKDEDDSVRT